MSRRPALRHLQQLRKWASSKKSAQFQKTCSPALSELHMSHWEPLIVRLLSDNSALCRSGWHGTIDLQRVKERSMVANLKVAVTESIRN